MNNKIIKILEKMIAQHDDYFDEDIARNILSRLSKEEVEKDISHKLRLEKLNVNLWGQILHYNYEAFSDAELLKQGKYFKNETIKKWEKLFNEFNYKTDLLYKLNISINDVDKIIESNNINFFNALGTIEYKNPWFEKANIIGLDKFNKEELCYIGMSLIHDGSIGKATSHINSKGLGENSVEINIAINEYLKTLNKKNELTDLLINSELLKKIAYDENLFVNFKDLFKDINKKHLYKVGDTSENISNRSYFFNRVKKLFPPEDWLNLFVENNELNLKDMFMKKINKLTNVNGPTLNNDFAYYAPVLKNYNISELNLTTLYIIIINSNKNGDLFKKLYEAVGIPEFSATTKKLYEKLDQAGVKLTGVEESVSYYEIIKLADNEILVKNLNETVPINYIKPVKVKL